MAVIERDENRQHLILEMMKMEKCFGIRVGDITARSNEKLLLF